MSAAPQGGRAEAGPPAEPVRYAVDGEVAVVTLNRPDRLNAWTLAMDDGYAAALDRAGEDPQVRAVVVTGAGPGFCAGADLDLLGDVAAGAPAEIPLRAPHTLAPALPKPVVAAVNGACAGLGLVHALMCDVRFAAAGAKLTTAFVRRGLVAEHGISWLLPQVVGFGPAAELLLSGRVLLAEEAARIGLVHRVVPGEELLAAATAYAAELAAACSPAAMADIKAQLWADAHEPLGRVADRAVRLMLASFRRPDVAEGVASYREGRPPAFPPLAAPGPPGS